MDLNRATVRELTEVVGLASAYDLVLWRPYLSWDEVGCVPGFDVPERVGLLQEAGYDVQLPDKVYVLHGDEGRTSAS